MQSKEKVLVLGVDRDNDLGEKANVKGPVIGKESALKAANALGLADPEDSDCNAIFQAVRVYNETKKQYKTEVAVLTGDRDVGIKSDKEITNQLSKVLKKFKADYVIFVSDGAEDEYVMPIIQSKVPILSVNKVIVRQAEQLESGYYKIKDFIQETIDNPKFSRLIFGLPAIILILYAVFGAEGWRAVVGVFGIYLLLKGFKLDDYIISGIEEMKESLTRRRFAFFTYIVGIAVFILGTYRGYEKMIPWVDIGIFELSSAFVSAAIFIYFLAAIIAWIGHSMSSRKRSGKTIASVSIFGFAVSFVIYSAAKVILIGDFLNFDFILSIVISFILIIIGFLIEWKG